MKKFLGRVAGWGLTQSGGKPSPQLKIVELPSILRSKCLEDSDIGFRPQITSDKFCAGLLNSNVSVCQGKFFFSQEEWHCNENEKNKKTKLFSGDSGGGLAFPSQENGREVWYLRGIVSTGASKQDSCDSDKYSTFTNILYYEPLITTYEPRYRPRWTHNSILFTFIIININDIFVFFFQIIQSKLGIKEIWFARKIFQRISFNYFVVLGKIQLNFSELHWYCRWEQ